MARSRNIKPAFFKNEVLADCSVWSRLLFIGLRCLADREGRLEDRPKRIWVEIFPFDNIDCGPLLDELHDKKFIVRYSDSETGDKYIQIINFIKHQQPHYKETPSLIPAMTNWKDSIKTPGGVPEKIRRAIIERDGKCANCESEDNLSIDHIIPRSLGGSHDESNLQVLCRKCNSSKNNKLASNSNLEPTLSQPRPNDDLNEVHHDTLIPSSLIPDSLNPHTLTPSPEKTGASHETNLGLPAPHPSQQPGQPDATPSPDTVVMFEALFAIWPAKKKKPQARQAYTIARNRGVAHETMTAGARRFAKYHAEQKTKEQFLQSLDDWINSDGWTSTNGKPANKKPQV